MSQNTQMTMQDPYGIVSLIVGILCRWLFTITGRQFFFVQDSTISCLHHIICESVSNDDSR